MCVLGLLSAIALSLFANDSVGGAVAGSVLFGKICIYYLLLISVVNSSARLRRFLLCLVLFILVPTGLSLLQYHGYPVVPRITTLEQPDIDSDTGEIMVSVRLRSVGIFNDPNDLCNIVVTGILLSLSRLNDLRSGAARFWWLAPIGMLGYAVICTKSRGGLLALLAGLGILSASRFGMRKTLLLGTAAVPLLLVVGGGRQTDLSTGHGTSQERIQLWSDALDLFKESPLFGIGKDMFADRTGMQAHNSFFHAFTDLGLVGGTCFCGAFFCLMYGCWRLGYADAQITDPELIYLRPYVLAVAAAFSVGLLSITRVYDVLPYLILGQGAAFLRLAAASGQFQGLHFNKKLALRIAAFSGAFVIAFYLFVRLFVNRGGAL
jgi:hypothetical protein